MSPEPLAGATKRRGTRVAQTTLTRCRPNERPEDDPMPRLTRLLVTSALVVFGGAASLLGGGCGIGVASSDCAPGMLCSCNEIGICTQTCTGRGCDFSCTGEGTCQFECPQGGCTASCANAGSCTLDCPGNDCALDCHGTGQCTMAACTSDCHVACGNIGTCEMADAG
jgi:hypothetical protein